jgi:hypothetical protein
VLDVLARALVVVGTLACLVAACDVVDLGTYQGVRDLTLDDNFFYCVVQPTVITAKKCADGDSSLGDPSGGCHASKSAMILADVPTSVACDMNGKAIGQPSQAERDNFAAAQLRVSPDVESSPILARPTGVLPHPRVIFTTDAPEANTLRQWISAAQ